MAQDRRLLSHFSIIKYSTGRERELTRYLVLISENSQLQVKTKTATYLPAYGTQVPYVNSLEIH